MTIQLDETYNVPSECVPFLKQFEIGQKIHVNYNGGLGGIYPIKGTLINIETPDFDILKEDGKVFNCVMGDIIDIRLIEDNEEYKTKIKEEIQKLKDIELQKQITETNNIIKELKNAKDDNDMETILSGKYSQELKMIIKLLININKTK